MTAGATFALTCGLVGAVTPAPATAVSAPRQVWSLPTPTMGESSPNVGTLQGAPAVVIGTHGSDVYAVRPDGSRVPGWPRRVKSQVESTPALADVDGDGRNEVFVGAGTHGYGAGARYRINENGGIGWEFNGRDAHYPSLAMFSSSAVGDVTGDGVDDVSSFALGLHGWSLNARTGAVNPGWPFYQDDTVFSSPAIADVDGDGRQDYVVGADSTPGGPVDHKGGMVRALRGDGTLIWQYRINEIVRSSPVVGDVDGDGTPEIVVGAGNYYRASDQNKLFVLNLDGTLKWSRDLGAQTLAAPALADVNGDGRRDIVMPTWEGPNAGRLWVFDGRGSALPGWGGVAIPGGVTLGQAATADFDNDGAQDVLVANGAGIWAFHGRTAQRMFSLNEGHGLGSQSTPWIGDFDGNGRLDIIAGATYATNPGNGVLRRWEFGDGTARLGAGNWSQYRGNAKLTGTTLGAAPSAPAVPVTPCRDAGRDNYILSSGDGGIFTHCASFHGSTGNMRLNNPVLGMARTKSGAGYWMVSGDGGIFSFGDARFHGSAGNIRLNQPIVGMARTPTGDGYWMVSRDGGIFTYGDARFVGSAGNIRLNQPIVAMAPSATGRGYWLASRDGGIFTFGDARFHGSAGGMRLTAPVVDITTTASGNGYWLTTADGKVITFGDAEHHGDLPAVSSPVVGMTRNRAGTGYWLAAANGTVHPFNAVHLGGQSRLNKPLIAIE